MVLRDRYTVSDYLHHVQGVEITHEDHRNNLVKVNISKYNINADQIIFEKESMEYQSYIGKLSCKCHPIKIRFYLFSPCLLYIVKLTKAYKETFLKREL